MSSFRAVYPSVPSSVRIARHALVAFAENVGFAGAALQDVEIAIGEALANASEHGYADRGSIEVRASFASEVLTIEVKDDGCGFEAWKNPATTPRDANSPRGFGIHIMRAALDRVEFRDGGTCVVLTKRFASQAASPDQRKV